MTMRKEEEEADEAEEEEGEERTLLVVREVCVYKIPVRNTSGGYKCGEWLQSDKMWSGRLRVVATGSAQCQIRLEDSNTGDLFATCPVEAGKREASVESALDSSRYFVLKVDDGRGRHAFIGLGFNERNDAFDFNVALSDHEKYAKQDYHQSSSAAAAAATEPSSTLDLRLKEGETMKINVKTASSRGAAASTSSGLMMKSNAGSGGGAGKLLMAPPPGGGRRIRSPLPPPPSNATTRSCSSSSSSSSGTTTKPDVLSDLSQLQAALPTSAQSSSNRSGGGGGVGWAAF